MEFEETKSSNFSELDEYVEVAAPNEAKEDETLDRMSKQLPTGEDEYENHNFFEKPFRSHSQTQLLISILDQSEAEAP